MNRELKLNDYLTSKETQRQVGKNTKLQSQKSPNMTLGDPILYRTGKLKRSRADPLFNLVYRLAKGFYR